MGIDLNFGNYTTQEGELVPRGLAKKSVHLFAGQPKTGKSTVLLQLLDAIARSSGRDVLAICAEEAFDQVSERAGRLKLECRERIVILPIENMSAITAEDAIALHKPALCVVDSLTGYTRDLLKQVEIAQALKLLAVLHNCPIVLVNQVNKGLDHQGREELQHAVDAIHMMEGEGAEPRMVVTDGNRYGQAGVKTYYEMTQEGLVEVQLDENTEDAKDDDSERTDE